MLLVFGVEGEFAGGGLGFREVNVELGGEGRCERMRLGWVFPCFDGDLVHVINNSL